MDKRNSKIRETMKRLNLQEFHNGLFTYGVLEKLWVEAKHNKSMLQLRQSNERFGWTCLVLAGLSFIIGITSSVLHNYEVACICIAVFGISLFGLRQASSSEGKE